MPPKCKFTKEEIVDCALNLVEEKGYDALTVRALAERLCSSSKPIFSLFENMAQVHKAVIEKASELYREYILSSIKNAQMPPYKASGMAYIHFAKENKELFKLLFMRQRNENEKKFTEDRGEVETVIGIIMKTTGLSKEKAELFHFEMWIFVHGIATMIASDYLDFDEKMVDSMLTDLFSGLKHKFCD